MKLNEFKWDFKGIWMPKELLFDERLTWVEKGLASFIYNVDNGDGICVSNDEFERLLEVGKRQIERILSNLRRFRYIAIEIEGSDRIIHSRIDYTVGGVMNVAPPCSTMSLLEYLKKDKEKEKENMGRASKMSPYTKEEEKEILEYYLIFRKEYFKKYGVVFSKNGITSKWKGQLKNIIDRMKKEGLETEKYISFCFSDNGFPPPKDSTVSIGWIAYRDSIIKFMSYKGINHKPVSEYRKRLAQSMREGTTTI